METIKKARTHRTAGIRTSVEVQHGRQGVARMFRRGLHGAKNWVLEPEEDGTPRTVWAKLFRVAVVLLPLWIVLSLFTGGPDRGGNPTSAPKTVFMALVVAVIGLACLSARERRQGREEPWSDLPPLSTESNDSPSETLIDDSTEAPTLARENAQVREVSDETGHRSRWDDAGDNAQMTQSEPDAFRRPFHQPSHQATPETPLSHAGHGSRPVETRPERGVPQAIPEVVVVDHSSDLASAAPGLDVPHPFEHPQVSLHKATRESAYSQVGDDEGCVPAPTRQAIEDAAIEYETGVTEGEMKEAPEVPDHTEFRGAFHQEAIPQLSPPEVPAHGPFQEPFRTEFAEPGPYEVTEDPICHDWWLTPPDAPQEEASEEVLEVAPEELAAPPAEELVAPPEETPEAPERERQQSPYPEVVMRYFMTRVSAEVPDEDREEARIGVIEWAREEITSHRRTQAEVARILGVGKATVSRWVNDDPWADIPD